MISIVIPCFNVSKYIERCLDSLFRQSNQNFQLILVNDCPTDDTMTKIKGYKHLHDFKNVEVTDLPVNGGVSNARNCGLFRASGGGYMCFIDPDDWIEEDYVSKLEATISANPGVDLIGFNVKLCSKNNKSLLFDASARSFDRGRHQVIKGLWATIWRFCFRTDLLKCNELSYNTELCGGEDYLFVCEAFLYAKSYAYIDDVLYNYQTFNSNSLMNSINLKGLSNQVTATLNLKNFLEDRDSLREYDSDLCYRYLYIKKLLFKQSLKMWHSWMPESNRFASNKEWRLKDRVVFSIMSFLSKGIK